MSTANAPLTKAVLRSLLWDGGAAAEACEAPTAHAAGSRPGETAYAPPPLPAPQHEAPLDELTLAKIRLLEMRRPPVTPLVRIARNPVPWVVGALLLGVVLGRSRIARAGLAWAGAKVVSRTVKSGASRFSKKKAARTCGNGRLHRWMNALS
jgi:hypothetical protein